MSMERTHREDVDFSDIADGTDQMPRVTPGEARVLAYPLDDLRAGAGETIGGSGDRG